MIDSIHKIRNEKLELFLGNHLENNNTEGKLQALNTAKTNPFIQNIQKRMGKFSG